MGIASRFKPSIVRVPVDFLFERVQNAQPRIRTECRSRNGHNVLSFLAGRGWDWPLYKPDQQYRVVLVASREVKFMSWRGHIQKLIRQNGILAQKFCLCGNLFDENSCLNKIKTLAEFLSSDDVRTAAILVQRGIADE